MIPALPCGSFAYSVAPGAFYVAAFEDGDGVLHVGEYRIETVIRALEALKACGYEDVEIGGVEHRDVEIDGVEHESLRHLTLVGVTDESNGRRPPGCIAVCPVVMSR